MTGLQHNTETFKHQRHTFCYLQQSRTSLVPKGLMRYFANTQQAVKGPSGAPGVWPIFLTSAARAFSLVCESLFFPGAVVDQWSKQWSSQRERRRFDSTIHLTCQVAPGQNTEPRLLQWAPSMYERDVKRWRVSAERLFRQSLQRRVRELVNVGRVHQFSPFTTCS